MGAFSLYGGGPSGYRLVGARDNESTRFEIALKHESIENWAAGLWEYRPGDRWPWRVHKG